MNATMAPTPRERADQEAEDLIHSPADLRARLVTAFLRGFLAGLKHSEDLSRIERQYVSDELRGSPWQR